jgi:peroxiredoxin
MKTKHILILGILSGFIVFTGFLPSVAPETTHIVLPVKHADSFDISRFKGKIVVLNFWASWSKISRTENKNLTHTYQTFKNNSKVVFASVSLDTEEANWKAAITEDEMVWKYHFCDFKKYNSPMALTYSVKILPKIIVFDESGKIKLEASNAHNIESKVNELLR